MFCEVCGQPIQSMACINMPDQYYHSTAVTYPHLNDHDVVVNATDQERLAVI